MKLRIKIFLITGGVLSILFLATSVFLSRHLSAEFLRLEKDNGRENINRLKDVFDEKESELSVKLVDWSQWDDMYAFVDDQSEEFIKSNFPKETFINLRINFVIVINKEGNIVYKKFVSDEEEEAAFPEGLEKYFAFGSQFVTFDKLSDSKQGVLLFPDGKPVVASVRPITSSDGTAPENGVVVFGYIITEKTTALLSQLTRTQVDFAPFEEGVVRDDFSSARANFSTADPIFVEEPSSNEKSISGYGLVNDVFGKPAIILSSTTGRDIYEKGVEIQRLFFAIMAVIALLFIVVVFGLFEFLVLRKLSNLSGEVKKINTQENKSMQLPVSGKDEFAQLGNDINKMLEEIRTADTRRREYTKEIERMNSLMVSRELRMVELKKEIAKLKGDVENKIV